MNLSNALKNAIKDETLIICLSENWGAQNPQYRHHLRQAILDELRNNGDRQTAESQILTLEQLPQSEVFSISISHSQDLGGFILSKKAKSLGLDIEPLGRVKQKIVNRISRENNSSAEAPTATHQWVAQEASFKAFSRLFPVRILSEIAVSKWDLGSYYDDLNQAHFISNFNGAKTAGTVAHHRNHLIAICAIFA